jgi:hypothetical protein
MTGRIQRKRLTQMSPAHVDRAAGFLDGRAHLAKAGIREIFHDKNTH